MAVNYSTYDYTERKQLTHINAYAGAVLKVYTSTVQIMSDVWEDLPFALVWNAAERQPVEMGIQSLADATVDATPEVIEAWKNWVSEKAYAATMARIERHAAEPTTGKVVVVKRGRKDKGLQGKIVFVKEMPYSMGYRASMLPKLCIAKDDHTVTMAGYGGKTFKRYVNVAWVWAHNTEVVNPTEYMTDAVERATKNAAAAVKSAVEQLTSRWRITYDWRY